MFTALPCYPQKGAVFTRLEIIPRWPVCLVGYFIGEDLWKLIKTLQRRPRSIRIMNQSLAAAADVFILYIVNMRLEFHKRRFHGNIMEIIEYKNLQQHRW